MTASAEAIPAKPNNPHNPQAAALLLKTADTYLCRADRLIYSYGSKTFLSGYAIFDDRFDGRGNIDCSTFVLLVLSGIPYEKSPYATGSADGLEAIAAVPPDKDLVDFSRLPRSYTGIAERIGRPYLSGPRGLDLEKAAALGISRETLRKEIIHSGVTRRSYAMARYFLEKDACFRDPACLRPGDIIFYLSSGLYREGNKTYKADPEVSHVGIVYRDTRLMVNSSGRLEKKTAADEEVPAVSLAPVFGTREPAFFARPVFRPVNGVIRPDN